MLNEFCDAREIERALSGVCLLLRRGRHGLGSVTATDCAVHTNADPAVDALGKSLGTRRLGECTKESAD